MTHDGPKCRLWPGPLYCHSYSRIRLALLSIQFWPLLAGQEWLWGSDAIWAVLIELGWSKPAGRRPARLGINRYDAERARFSVVAASCIAGAAAKRILRTIEWAAML